MSTVVTPPSQRSTAPPPRRRWPWAVIVVLVVLVVAAVAVTGWTVVGAVGGASTATDRAVVTEPVTAVDLDVSAGAVVVEGATGDDVELAVTRRWTVWGEPEVRHEVVGGTLRVTGDCPGWFAPSCETDVQLTVPPEVAVTLSSDTGSVDVRGREADVDARTSAGPVTVTDVTGDVRLSTAAGPIRATGLDSDRIEASSSAGGVTVEADEPPSRLVATTSAGGVSVVVPDVAYDVDASSAVGEVDVDVVSDPSSPRQITARTSAGGVQVRQR